MSVGVPELYVDAVRHGRELTEQFVERARTLAKAGDLAELRVLPQRLAAMVEGLNNAAGGHLHAQIVDLRTAFEDIIDGAFPIHDPTDVDDVLDAPMATRARTVALASLVDTSNHWQPHRDPLAEPAIAAGDLRRLRLLLVSPVGYLDRETSVRILDVLHAAGALDAEVIDHVLLDDPYLGYIIAGRPLNRNDAPGPPAACAEFVRDRFDELIWRLTDPDGPAPPSLPRMLPLRGLRFVLRALDGRRPPAADQPAAGEAAVDEPAVEEPGDGRVEELGVDSLGAAELTDDELAALAKHLRDRSVEEQWRACKLRVAAGDAPQLLALLGMKTSEWLLRLVLAAYGGRIARVDRAAVLAAAEEAGPDGTRSVLERWPSEVVSAALGDNRAAVLKRVKNNAQQAIAALGILPLAEGETVLDRYLALREAGKQGAKFGAERRLNHAAAVAVALDHLAQVAGLPDADRLEWDCEARLVAETPGEWQLGDYTVAVRIDGTDAAIEVAKAGKPLKSVPAAVRTDARYATTREHQQRLRDQASRMRTGLIEKLVATGGAVQPDELARLLTLPSAAAMLPNLIFRDHTGAIGLLDQIDRGATVRVVHPVTLFELGRLAEWQAETVQRRLRQPVKQAFRELYVLTPAERSAVDVSARFAGHTVNGTVAARLFARRGWRLHGEYDPYQMSRPVGAGLVATLCSEFHGYLGLSDALIGELRFLRDGAAVPLDSVPPIAFSETMRDLDLVVSVAGTNSDGYASGPTTASRVQLLTALIEDLGLTRVTIDGTSAVVRGSRATYRVHLNSGSIHVEPGGYLCVVPATFGGTAHRRLFLPFADEDRMTSVILSKVLLLNDDERITDPGILTQLQAHTQSPQQS